MYSFALAALVMTGKLDRPTFEAHPRHPTVAPAPSELDAAFAALLPTDPPVPGPLVLTATLRHPKLPMAALVAPHSLGLQDQPDQNAFLLELAQLVPPESLDPVTAGRLADRLYDAGRRTLAPAIARWEQGIDAAPFERFESWPAFNPAEAELWMTAALPLYRQAATGEVHHPERLAVRLAWAARLGGGTRADLDEVAALLAMGAPGPWAWEAREVLADAWLQAPTWSNQRALAALRVAYDDPDSPSAAWSHYALAWGYNDVGAYDSAVETLKSAITTQPPEPVTRTMLADLAGMGVDAGWDPCNDLIELDMPCTFSRPYETRLLPIYLEQGKFDLAHYTYHLLRKDGALSSEIIPAILNDDSTLPEDDKIAFLTLIGQDDSTVFEALDPSTREAVAERIASDTAEQQYGARGHIDPAKVSALREAYALSLRLDPNSPKRDAVATLMADLGTAPKLSPPSDPRR